MSEWEKGLLICNSQFKDFALFTLQMPMAFWDNSSRYASTGVRVFVLKPTLLAPLKTPMFMKSSALDLHAVSIQAEN